MKNINGWYLPDFDNLLSKQASKSTYPESRYQQEIFDAALTFVTNFNQAVDIGANIGFHSTRLGKLFKNVKAFEPSTINFECLRQNTKSFTNIEIFHAGVGNISTELILELPNDNDNCGAFSFVDFVENTNEKIIEKVKVFTLDELDINPDFIKIDTQGFEKNVLLGSIQTIKKTKPVILAEVAKKGPIKELLDILQPLGYEISWASNSDKVFSFRR
jgi:FkbM family methyltransferase